MRPTGNLLSVTLLALCAPALLGAIDLQPETLKSWDDYIRTTESRMQIRLDAHQRFLWIDEIPDRVARLRHGEIVVAPAVARGTVAVPGGLIHHWIGAVFIPNATLDDLFAVVHDYNRYTQIYKPVVANSKALACTAAGQRFSMVWQNRILFVNAAVEGEYEAHDTLLGAARGYSIAGTTRVQEIEGYRRRDEHLLPPGQGNGFIWRIHSIARYEQRDGGVYLELEAIALTRDIPPSLAWLVTPVANRLSIGSLTATLRQTRAAVAAIDLPATHLTACSGPQVSAFASGMRGEH